MRAFVSCSAAFRMELRLIAWRARALGTREVIQMIASVL